jgi:uncharacterized damage-inducible protein DinB
MNPPDVLTHLFQHHLWANLRLLESCSRLSQDQLAFSLPGAYGSIRETLQHIVRAEQSYFSRISTGKSLNRPANPPPMSFDEMAESLRRTGSGLIDWVSKVQPEDTVILDWEGQPRIAAKTVIVTQVINHAGEHREQIKAMITALGIEPPDLQSWAYFDEIDRSSDAGSE